MINKGLLNYLIQTHEVNSIEHHLLYSFLIINKLSFNNNPILTDYFENFEQNPQLYRDATLLNVSGIKELENYLELLIPAGDKKLNGAFFTPEYIINYIIHEIQPGKMTPTLTQVAAVVLS